VATSGITVTTDNGLQSTAVFACVRVLSGALASCPRHVMQTTDAGKRKAKDHPLYRVVHLEPNDEMTGYHWIEAGMVALLLWGNAYSYIELDQRRGRVAALWPLNPDRVEPVRNDAGRIVYDVSTLTGQTVPSGGVSLDVLDTVTVQIELYVSGTLTKWHYLTGCWVESDSFTFDADTTPVMGSISLVSDAKWITTTSS
jgi:HK97 family phage portal protein